MEIRGELDRRLSSFETGFALLGMREALT